jgi:hypothetical protein
MSTLSKPSKSFTVDISKYTKEKSNPIIKAFLRKGSVFGFAAYFIVQDHLGLVEGDFDDVDLLLDEEGKTYKVFTTKDLAPSFTKGCGRSKDKVDFKTHLMLQSDYICILEKPFSGKCLLNIYRPCNIKLSEKGILL